MSSEKKFNVGVIGYGLSAKVFHIPFIKLTPSLNLHSILQRKPNDSDNAPADYPDLKHFTDLDSFLSDASLDVVVLCIPPNTHFSFTKAALEAGKHVFVEKPFVPTASEADKLVQLAKEKGKLICVYQNRRWDSDFLTVKKLLHEGKLGRIIEFETHFDRFRPEKPTTWKGTLGMDQAGGVIYDLGTHLIDQAYVLFGKPKGVFAKFVNQRDGKVDPEDPDSVTVQMFYDDGLLVQVRAGVFSVESQQLRYWVRGSKGSYHKYHLDPQEDQLKEGMKGSESNFGVETEDRHGKLSEAKEDGKVEETTYPTVEPATYSKIYELFAKALQSGKNEDVPVPASQAADVLRIIEAARESAKTGREVSP